jgi:hypothetical protein
VSAEQLFDQIAHDMGWNDHNMQRNRPYTGQPHTDTGERGRTEVKGVTFRDLRDCFIRAFLLSNGTKMPAQYAEACKGEAAALCENDLYGWDLNQIDPNAVFQNFSCEVEKMMGIYPNVPALSKGQP